MKKRVTMADIAKELGVSINAVSLALNDRAGVGEDTRKKVLNLAEELGYLDQSTKYLTSYSNKNICILLENRFFNDMQFYGRILLGLEDAAKKAGYDLLINSFETTKEIPSCVVNHKVAGIIVVGKIEDDFLTRLKEYKIPILLLDYTSPMESVDSVMTDNLKGAYKMTKYLMDKGFHRIGFFGGLEYSPSIRERFFGYLEAIQQNMGFSTFEESTNYAQQYSMLENVETYVIHKEHAKLGELFQKIKKRPEVLLCSNDKAAILLCKALGQLGYSIPRDISIAGFDDIELSKMVIPRITTVHVYKELMGRTAMECLLKRMEFPKRKIEKVVMDIKIVERDSVGEPKNWIGKEIV